MKIKILIIFCLIIFFSSISGSAEEKITGNIYFGYDINKLKKEEQNLINQPDSFEKFVKLGLVYHTLAEKGEIVSQSAIDNFEKALQIEPDNYYVQAFLGSTYTLLSNELKGKTLKMEKADKGIKILDQVLKDHPDDYDINILVAFNSMYLPDKLFGRLKIAQAIIEKLLKDFDQYEPQKKAEVLYLKSLFLFSSAKELEAIELWKKIVKEYKKSSYAELAKEKLKTYTE